MGEEGKGGDGGSGVDEGQKMGKVEKDREVADLRGNVVS